MKLRKLWDGWLRIAKIIGEFQSRLILTVFYFLIMGPVALCLRMLSDPLRLEVPEQVKWSAATTPAEPNIETARRQF